MSASSLTVDPVLFRGTVRRAFAIPMLLVALLAGLMVWQTTALLRTVYWLEHSDQVIAAMQDVEHETDDESTAVHSEIATHQPSFQLDFERLAARTNQKIAELRRSVSDNPDQVARFDRIATLHRQWVIESRRQILEDNASELDRQYFARLTALHASWQDVIAAEEQLRAERLARINLHTHLALLLVGALCMLLGAIAYALTRRRLHTVAGAYSAVWRDARRSARKLQATEEQARAARQILDLNASLEQTNQRLLQRERDLHEAQRLAGIGSWEIDLETSRVTWSEELYRIFDLVPGEQVPDFREQHGMFTEESWELLQQHIERAAKSGEFYELELDIVRRDGRSRKVLANGEAERDRSGVIVRLRGTAQDITERKALEERLIFEGRHDALTGLANRQLLQEKLEESLRVNAAAGRLTGVLYLDVDNFKFLNDTMGHASGDMLLKSISERIVTCVRGVDTVGRLGGDEFVVLCSRMTNEKEVEAVAARIMSEIRKPLQVDGADAFVSLSMGVAIAPRDGDNVQELLKNADLAMYQAKQFSRDTYMFYTPEMNRRVQHRVETERELRCALERNEFLLYYQPRISLQSGRITGIESLIRWQHPHKGLVLPGNFIEIAEASGLIVPIGEWALDAACSQAQRWRVRGLLENPMAVNVSIAQLKRNNFTRTVENALRRYNLPPGSIEIEITESLLLEDADLFSKQICSLKELGVHIAIDDFGTRYSNLNYLKKMPVDTLKIDQSFVRDIDKDSSDAAICRSIITLAQNLRLRTVGEGVESFPELNCLRRFGCDDVQGFLLATPQPPELIESSLERTFELLPPMSLVEQSTL